MCYGSLRTSPVLPSSGTLRGSEEEAAQGNPGGGVCKTSSLRRTSLESEAKKTSKNRVRWRSMVEALCSPLGAKMA